MGNQKKKKLKIHIGESGKKLRLEFDEQGDVDLNSSDTNSETPKDMDEVKFTMNGEPVTYVSEGAVIHAGMNSYTWYWWRGKWYYVC